MIQVKLYGLLRVESGIKERHLEAGTVKEVLHALAEAGIPKEKLAGSVILVNDAPANKRTKLKDGDRVTLLSPVAGG